MKKILILHGVNLNMLGKRPTSHYGTLTLEEINRELTVLGEKLGVEVECYQTNSESDMVECIHRVHEEKGIDGIVINPGAWTHYSYAIRDALEMLTVPVVEVHMSHIYAREPFRHTSVIAPIAKGQISGFGVNSYILGLRAVVAEIL